MTYEKTNWTDTTPINIDNLQKLEDGVEENSNTILTGEITITSLGGLNGITVDYPEGFTKDNCIPIAFGTGGQRTGFGTAGLDYGITVDANNLSLLNGSFSKSLVLNESNINIRIYVASTPDCTGSKFPYQVTLMKVA